MAVIFSLHTLGVLIAKAGEVKKKLGLYCLTEPNNALRVCITAIVVKFDV
jgi:hypothetical protein